MLLGNSDRPFFAMLQCAGYIDRTLKDLIVIEKADNDDEAISKDDQNDSNLKEQEEPVNYTEEEKEEFLKLCRQEFEGEQDEK